MVTTTPLTIGVLAFQGAFARHEEALRRLGVATRLVKVPSDLSECHGLVLPGGESTTMSKHMAFLEMQKPLMDFAQNRPIFGTCAGLILMARHVEGGGEVSSLGLLDITVRRNAYGRQIHSFTSRLPLHGPGLESSIEAIFIRAPQIVTHGPDVRVLAEWEGQPVLVQQGHWLGASFHPELSTDLSLHRYFVSLSHSRCELSEKT